MTITNGYLTLATLKAELNITDTDDDTRLEAAINTASRQIDAHCGRRFWQDATVVERTYHADSRTLVGVDDISTDTGLIVQTDEDADGTYERTLTVTTDYLLYPLNAESESPARPWEWLVMVDNFYFPTGRRPGVKVTAKFGWAAVPDPVATACSIQAKNIYKVTGSGVFGSVQLSPDGIPMNIPGLDYAAKAQLEDFRRTVVG